MAPFPANDEEYSVETRDASPSHLLTKVEPFSKLSKHEIQSIQSSEFEEGNCKWKVIINLDEGEHVSAKLSMVGTTSLPAGWEVNAIFTFFLYNHITDKYTCFRGKPRRFHAVNFECEFSKLMTRKSLTEAKNGHILKDKLVYGAEVFVIKKQPLIEKVSVLKSSNPHKREWKISKFSKLERIWNSEEFSVGGYKWKIEMYPNGNGSACGSYVSIYLRCVDAKSFPHGKKVNAACLFTLKNMLNDKNNHSMKLKAASHELYTSTARGWGFRAFKAVDDMRDQSKGFVIKDCCILEIQLSVRAIHELE